MERGGFVDCAEIVLDVLFSLGLSRCGKHAAATNAGDMQSRVVYLTHAGIEARLLNLVPPQRDRGNALTHACLHSLADAPA